MATSHLQEPSHRSFKANRTFIVQIFFLVCFFFFFFFFTKTCRHTQGTVGPGEDMCVHAHAHTLTHSLTHTQILSFLAPGRDPKSLEDFARAVCI